MDQYPAAVVVFRRGQGGSANAPRLDLSYAAAEAASLISGALAVATGADLPQRARDRLRAAAWSCDIRGIGLQTSAMLVVGGESPPTKELSARLASTVAREHWGQRMDLLSVNESLELLGHT